MHPDVTEPTTIDDAACIEASIDSPDRFGVLFDRHALTVFRYVRSRLGPDADDAVGDTFAEAFRSRQRFDAERGRSALPWLLGIATRIIARRREAEVRWLRPAPIDATTDHESSDAIDTRLDDARLSPWLCAALAGLRRRDRDALVLHVVGDLSIEEVARALDVPPGTVKSRLHRARRILAAQLEVHR